VSSRWLRLLAAAAVLALLLWRVGAGPFVDGLRLVDGWSLMWACAISGITTVCCAWRWHLVSRGLGVPVPLASGVAAYYRSQFLNLTTPGGVAGDVHRAVRHGREVGDVGRSARAVVWERSAGQVVQVVLTVVVLLVAPSPVHDAARWLAVALAVAALVGVVVGRAMVRTGTRADGRDRHSLLARTSVALVADVRDGLLAARAWPGVVLASVVVVVGHTTTFLVAARTAGSSRPWTELVPLALLVLAAMALPLSLGGWGPREGVAAWAFAAAGLGAALGVTTAVVYGVLVLVASLPGAVVLLVQSRRGPTAPQLDVGLADPGAATAGAVRGPVASPAAVPGGGGDRG